MQKHETAEHRPYPLGEPGQMATYQHESESSLPNTVVKTLTVVIGSVVEEAGVAYQWICLCAMKVSGEKFAVWLLGENIPSEDLKVARVTTSRYILQIGDDFPLEFRDRFTGEPVLPSLGAWQYLFPRPADETGQRDLFPQTVKYLGHTYRLTHISDLGKSVAPPDTKPVATICLIMNSSRLSKPITTR